MSQIFDEDLLKSEIPKLPSCWKTIEIQYFLGFVKKDALKQKFLDQNIDGPKFLEMSNNANLWSELSLSKDDMTFLQKCAQKLKQYDYEENHREKKIYQDIDIFDETFIKTSIISKKNTTKNELSEYIWENQMEFDRKMPDAEMKITLITQNGKDFKIPEIVTIDKFGIEIKKSKYFDLTKCIVINDDSVSSGRHARIFYADQAFLLLDMGSFYGTFCYLQPGKKILLKPKLIFALGDVLFYIAGFEENIISFKVLVPIKFIEEDKGKEKENEKEQDKDKERLKEIEKEEEINKEKEIEKENENEGEKEEEEEEENDGSNLLDENIFTKKKVKIKKKRNAINAEFKFDKKDSFYEIGREESKNNKANYYTIEHESIENETYAKMIYDGKNFYLEAVKKDRGLWYNLKNRGSLKLEEGTIFRVGKYFEFQVTQTVNKPFPKCNVCKVAQCNAVFLPCKHICCCYSCADSIKKCNIKDCVSNEPSYKEILTI